MITPFSVHPTFRDTFGLFNAYAVDQIQPAIYEPCYRPKFYKTPDDNREVIPANSDLECSLEITPGSILIGYWHNLTTGVGGTSGLGGGTGYLLQIRDESLCHYLQRQPVPDYFVGNYDAGFPNLLCAPYPVTGKGRFSIHFLNPTSSALRCELVLGVLEVCECLQGGVPFEEAYIQMTNRNGTYEMARRKQGGF